MAGSVNSFGHGIEDVAVVHNWKTVAVTPTLDVAAYATGDSLASAAQQFVGCARNAGGTGVIKKLFIVDRDAQAKDLEIWIFHSTVTPAAANAAHSISDADADKCLGVISIAAAGYASSALNAVGTKVDVNFPFKCAAGDSALYGVLVTRSNPTYTVNGLTISLVIEQD